ncbi:hypothetical protein ACOSQ4_004720 [Xanthoceras sorbifolium]
MHATNIPSLSGLMPLVEFLEPTNTISIGFSRIILCWCEIFEFQLEDNVWDDFGESDDHIVLHLSEYKEQFVTWGDS